MSDTMEIIISAVDSASEVFQGIIESVTGMGDSISDVVGMAGSDFDSMAENVIGFQNAVSDIDSSSIEDLANELGLSTDEVERLIETGANLGSIPFNDAAASADELEQEITETTDAMEGLNNSAGDVMVAQTFKDMADSFAGSMMGMVDSAGSFEDSVNRASLEAEGFGVSADEMKATVSELSEVTGRAGGQIRESFIKAAARGVTDMGSFKTMMEGASAQAYLFGTDVQTMANSFSSLATKSSVSEKFLANMGITMGELGEAMGMTGATADEVKEKWKELDTNQRAAILGTAASMNEGQDANEEYKNSWQGLQDQIDIAKGRLERIIGSVILPVVVPAMQIAGDILDGVGDTIDFVMKSPLGGLVSVLGTAAGMFLIVASAVISLTTFLGFLRIGTMLDTTATLFNTAAKILNGEASGIGAIANALLGESFMASAAAAWTAAAGFIAASWPLLVLVGAIALVVVAIYELGKSFGWWTDVSSMIDAIKAGLMELWDAFINHPDVQAAIQAISNAWNTLSSAVGEAWNAILEFFNLTGGGEFDILHALINGIGEAWNNIREPVMAVIDIFTTIISTVWDVLNGNMSVTDGIYNVWNSLLANIPTILNALFTLYVTIWTAIWNFIITALSNIINSVISYMSQLPGIAFNWLNNARLRMMAQFNAWVTLARSRLTTFVNGIITRLAQLPGKVYNKLYAVVSQISSAIQSWITTASTKVSTLISDITSPFSGVASAISGALSGVASAITAPFKAAWETLEPIVSKIEDGMKLIGAAGGEFAAGGEESGGTIDNVYSETTNNTYIQQQQPVDKEPIEIEHTLRIILDLINVPAHIDADDLIRMLNDKKVLSSLTSNRDFQLMDGKAKERLNLKINRARGV